MDPQGLAQAARYVRVGPELYAGVVGELHDLGSKRLPVSNTEGLTLVLVSEVAGLERSLWVTALDVGEVPLARGRAHVRFTEAGSHSTAVLYRACDVPGSDVGACALEEGQALGICNAGSCAVSFCGDGLVDPATAEECDGDTSCDNTCRTIECGNGLVQAGEECDPGTLDADPSNDDPSCDSACRSFACGNSVVQLGEACDDGNANPNDGCDACFLTQWVPSVLVGLGDSGGEALNEFVRPVGIDANRSRTLIVGDTLNHATLALTPLSDGSFRSLRVVGSGVPGIVATPAAGGTQLGAPRAVDLNAPGDVALDERGLLYIADVGNNRFLRADPGAAATVTLLAWPATDAIVATGVEVDGTARVYLTQMHRTDPTKNLLRRLQGSGIVPPVVLAGGTGVGNVTSTPQLGTSVQLRGPMAVAVSPDNTTVIIVERDVHAASVPYTLTLVRFDVATAMIQEIPGAPHSTGGTLPADVELLSLPHGVVVSETGAIIWTDPFLDGGRVLQTDGTTGVTTVLSADVSQPLGVTLLDDGAGGSPHVLVASYLERQVVDLAAGAMVGPGPQQALGDGRPALSLRLATSAAVGGIFYPQGVAIDGLGNLYIAEAGARRVRRVDAVTQRVSTPLGLCQDSCGVGSDAQNPVPATGADIESVSDLAILIEDVQTNDHRLFFSEPGAHRVSQARIEGSAEAQVSVFFGPSKDAAFATPTGLGILGRTLYIFARDGGGAGAIWAVDVDDPSTFQKITPSANCNATPTALGPAGDVAAYDDAGTLRLYVADALNNRVLGQIVGGATSIVANGSCVACTGAPCGDGGPALAGRLEQPVAIVVDPSDGRLFVGDSGTQTVRVIGGGGSPVISTLAGVMNGPATQNPTGVSGDFRAASLARLDTPVGVALGNGSLYVSTQTLSTATSVSRRHVRRIELGAAPAPVIYTVAGRIYGPGERASGPAINNYFDTQYDLAPAGQDDRWIVSEGGTGTLIELDLASGRLLSRVGYPDGFSESPAAAGSSRLLNRPNGLARVGGIVYVAEQGNHVLRAFDMAANSVSDAVGVASTPPVPGYADGDVAAARFSGPSGLASDGVQRLYVVDQGNHVLRQVDLDSGTICTIAGVPGVAGRFDSPDGIARDQLFDVPNGVAVSPTDGSIYVAEAGNSRIVRVLLGGDGTCASAHLATIATVLDALTAGSQGMVVDSHGNLFVSSQARILRLARAQSEPTATGMGPVDVIYGDADTSAFPQSATNCLAGLEFRGAGDGSNTEDKLLALDYCQGLLIELRRERM